MGECKAEPVLRDESAFIGKDTASPGGQALGVTGGKVQKPQTGEGK